MDNRQPFFKDNTIRPKDANRSSFKTRIAKDIYDTGFDGLLQRGNDNSAISTAEFSGSDMQYLKVLQAAIDSIGVNSVNNLTGDVTLTTTNIAEGTNLYFTDERAQDAVGNILLDTSSIDFTYNDGGPTITADIKTAFTDGLYYRLDGTNDPFVLAVNTTPVGNVTTGEDDLITYSLTGGVMSANGQTLEFEMAGTFAANANNKRIRVYLGATVLFDTTALAINGKEWRIMGRIIRTGAATQKSVVVATTSDALLVSSCDYVSGAEDLTTTLVLKATGEGTNTDDIVQEFLVVKKTPQP